MIDYNAVHISTKLLTQIFSHVTVQSTGYHTSCWLWTKLDGSLSPPNKYSLIPWKQVSYTAHRLMYALFNEPISDYTLVADHLCRRPSCINPAHIEMTSTQENILRGIGEASKNAQKTHCKYGHELTPDNLIQYRNGITWRTCKQCARNANIARYRKDGRQDKYNRTTCYKGHPYTPENTRYVKNGNGNFSRRCRICQQAYNKQYYAKAAPIDAPP